MNVNNELRFINIIRSQQQLEELPIKALDRNCKLMGYRIELWKYNHKMRNRYEYRNRNVLILHKED